jgi:hypothetical protein
MPAKTTAAGPIARDTTVEIAYLTPRDAVARQGERARAEGWTHERFLAACLTARSAPASPTSDSYRLKDRDATCGDANGDR